MRRTSNAGTRSGILFTAVVVLASSGAIGSSASATQPASLVILSGEAAALLQVQNSPARPLLVAGGGGNVFAIAFDEDPNRAAVLPGELFSTNSVENCVGDGPVACCDRDKGMMVLSATYNGQNGWVQMGELCEAPDIEAVDFVPVPEEVSSELNAKFGVDYCFMELADANGIPRVLVNAPSSDSPIWSYCFMLLTAAEQALPTLAQAPARGGAPWLTSLIMLRATSPIIPAAHPSAPPPPRCQSATPAAVI